MVAEPVLLRADSCFSDSSRPIARGEEEASYPGLATLLRSPRVRLNPTAIFFFGIRRDLGANRNLQGRASTSAATTASRRVADLGSDSVPPSAEPAGNYPLTTWDLLTLPARRDEDWPLVRARFENRLASN